MRSASGAGLTAGVPEPDKGEDHSIRPRLLLMTTPDPVDFHGEKVGFHVVGRQLAKKRGISEQVKFKLPPLFGEPVGLAIPASGPCRIPGGPGVWLCAEGIRTRL